MIDVQRYREIAAHKDAIDAQLFQLPEVTAIWIGYKTVGGVETEEMAIMVSVKKKGDVAPAQRIPARVEGFKTDVIENEVRLSPPRPQLEISPEQAVGEDLKRYDPLKPGCSVLSVKPRGYLGGSLGPAVVRPADSRQYYLGCWHVFCDTDQWKETDYNIYQPFGINNEQNSIGLVADGMIGRVQKGKQTLFVDAAIFQLNPRARQLGLKIPGIGGILGTVEEEDVDDLINQEVAKYGFVTGLTRGQVVTTHYSWIHPDAHMMFQRQILVKPIGAPKFNEEGDSGAPVLTFGNADLENRLVTGIMMGKNSNDGTGVVNPMWMIKSALNVSIVRDRP